MHKRKILLLSVLLVLTLFTVLLTSPKHAYAATPLTNRLYGLDRYETNIAIIKNGWTQASDAVIASGEDFPDALCAAPLAGAKKAPIVLTKRWQLNSSAIDELKRLNVKNAYIIGGTGVISTNIEKQLKDMNITWTRLAGQDRYQTSVKVAELLGTNNGIVVATGENFPDALGIAPIAAKLGMPVLLSQRDFLPGEVSAYLRDKNIPVSYLVGGTGVLSDNVKSSLKNAKRLSGSDRFATNINILREFDNKLDLNSIYIASGIDFPDALSGSVLAANSNAPIVLVDDEMPPITSTYLMDLNCRTINILGGTGAVSAGLENTLKTIIKYLTITRADDISDIAFISEKYNFPQNVLVTYDDSSTKLVPVKWNSDSLDTSKPGLYSFEGIIPGYAGKVKLNTKVITETSSIYGNHVNGGGIAYYKGDVFFINIPEGSKIYKYGRNGLPHTKLNNDLSAYISVVYDWIYYSNISAGGRVYRMRLDGTEKTKVTDESISSYMVVGDWMYYSYQYQGTAAFYMMRTDGSNKIKLSSEDIVSMAVSDGYLYYINNSDGCSVWKMKLDGSERNRVSKDSVYFINIADSWIYYSNSSDNGKIYKIKTDGTGRTRLGNDSAGSLNVYDGWIYYSNRSDNYKFYRIRTDGTGRTNFVDSRVSSIYTLGDYIVYQNEDGSSNLWEVKLDGSYNSRFGVTYVYDREPDDSISTAVDYKLSNLYEYSYVISGSLQKGDVDIYRVKPNYSNDLNIFFSSSGIAENAVITLLDESGTPLGSLETDSDGIAFITVPSIMPGTYYIKVSSKSGSTLDTNKYFITAWLEKL